MTLLELDPRWIANWRFPNGSSPFMGHGMGISFLCPIHKDHRLAVFFQNPIDGFEPEKKENLWHRIGDTFENLSLTPSINAENHWHGHIVNGQIQ